MIGSDKLTLGILSKRIGLTTAVFVGDYR